MPGNAQAKRGRKSHLYKQAFRQEEIAALEAQPALDILAEIDLLRVAMRRTIALVDADIDLEKMVDILCNLGMAANRVGSLVRIQAGLHGEDTEIASEIHNSLREAMKGWPITQ